MVRNGLLNRLQEQLRRLAKSSRSSRHGSSPTSLRKPSARARGVIGSQDPAARTFQALRIAVNRGAQRSVRRACRMLTARLRRGRAACGRSASIRSRTASSSASSPFASRPFGGDARLARMPIARRRCRRAPLAIVGRAIKPADAEVARNPRARSAVLRVAERTAHALPGDWPRGSGGAAMTRVNVLLLCVLVVCALSLVTSRHQARRLFVELEREQAQRAAVRRRVRPAVARAVDVGRCRRASRRSRASQLRMQLPDAGARRGRCEDGEAGAMTSAAPCAHARARPRRRQLPRVRALLRVRRRSALLFVGAARPLAVPAVDRQRVPAEPGRGALLARDRGSRASRPHRRPLRRRARDLDAGEVAVGVPRQDRRDARRSSRSSRACSRRRRSSCRRASRATATSRSSRGSSPPETAERATGARHPGTERAERIPALLPGRRSDGADDRLHRRQGRGPGRHRARAAGVARRHAGQPARDHQPPRRHRRGRRGDPRAAGRPRSRAVDRLAAAVPRVSRAARRRSSATRRKAGGLVVLDAKSGEILALANWPTYNPNRRDKVARDKMRNRALTDTFEPGSTMKPFTIAAALEAGKVRPDTVIHTEAGDADDRPADDPRRASRTAR